MGFSPNPLQSYQNVGFETDIRGSDPHRLILLLFEGAQAALVRAKDAINRHDIAEKSASLTKAVEIINDGLVASLNLEAGGELAGNLRALYDYMVSRLIHANFNNDLAAIEEVAQLLGEIHEAWRGIGPAGRR